MMSVSTKYRQQGNEYYKMAAAVGGDLKLVAAHLQKSALFYEDALKYATHDDERAFALRNLGMANWRLGKNCLNRSKAEQKKLQADGSTVFCVSNRTDHNPYVMLHFYKGAIDAFSRCSPLARNPLFGCHGDGDGSNNNSKQFLDKLAINLNDCAMEALSYLENMDYFSTYPARIDQLDYLISACGDHSLQWAAAFQLEKAGTLHKWAVTEMGRSNNYSTALRCLKACYSPMETIRNFDVISREEWQDMQDSIKIDTTIAEAMKCIEDGDALLLSSIFDSEYPNIDGVHEAIFHYRLAIVALHDANLNEFLLEAEAFSKAGQAYYNILKNATQARTYCHQAIQLAGTRERHNFSGKEWFDKAAAILKEIQDKERKAEEEKARKEREPVLKKLEPELKKLRAFEENSSAETLITELPKTFPPKHKLNSKQAEELAKLKFTKDTPRADVKKALSKLIVLYHPDHVDKEEFGMEHFVLCEEITKVITQKYEYFKG